MTTTDVANEVAALEQERIAAMMAADETTVPRVEKLLSEDYCHIHPNGRVDDKATHLAMLARGIGRARQVSRDNVRVLVHGDTAVLIGRLVSGPNNTEMTSSQTWVRQDGAWKLVSNQATNITPPAQ